MLSRLHRRMDGACCVLDTNLLVAGRLPGGLRFSESLSDPCHNGNLMTVAFVPQKTQKTRDIFQISREVRLSTSFNHTSWRPHNEKLVVALLVLVLLGVTERLK